MTLTASPQARRPSTLQARSASWFLGLSALAIVVFAWAPYLTSSLQDRGADPSQIAATYVDQPLAVQVALYLHVFFAGLALLLSPLQFSARLRARARRLHRAVGRVVLGSIAVAGCAGLVIAPFNRAGVVGIAGFGMLGILWLVFAAAAFRAIRRRDVAAHRRWAVRAFAVTYAAVTLRLWLIVLVPLQVGLTGTDAQVAFDRAYLIVPFLSWVPNLLVAERHLAAGRRRTAMRAA